MPPAASWWDLPGPHADGPSRGLESKRDNPRGVGKRRRNGADMGRHRRTGSPRLAGQVRSVSAVAWSPDGRQLLGGGGAGRLEVSGCSGTGQSARTWSAHSGPCSTVAWSPDGKRIASASEEGRIKVWNAGTAQEFCTLEGHQGLLRALVWSPDGGGWPPGAMTRRSGSGTWPPRKRSAPCADSRIRFTGWLGAPTAGGLLRGQIGHGTSLSRSGRRPPAKVVLALQHADDVAHVRGPVAWSPDGAGWPPRAHDRGLERG